MFSDDQIGRFVIRKCAGYGVDTNSCRTQPGLWRNSLAIAETKPTDAAVVIYRNQAADLQLSCDDVALVDFQRCWRAGGHRHSFVRRAVSFSRQRGFSAARQAGCPVVIDIDYRANAWETAKDAARRLTPELAQADILVGNDDEFAVLCGWR